MGGVSSSFWFPGISAVAAVLYIITTTKILFQFLFHTGWFIDMYPRLEKKKEKKDTVWGTKNHLGGGWAKPRRILGCSVRHSDILNHQVGFVSKIFVAKLTIFAINSQ